MSEQKQIEEVLRFSKANSKLEKLYKVKELKPYLIGKRKVYSLDMLSGHSCKGAAKQCFAQVEVKGGQKKLVDGKYQEFRCYSAFQELIFPAVYNLRKKNLDLVIQTISNGGQNGLVDLIDKSLPKDSGIIRFNAAGDFPTKMYFKACLEVVNKHPDILFYAYTKKLPFWIECKEEIDKLSNFTLTASYGGWHDKLIEKHGLRNSTVVFSQYQAKKLGLRIDFSDELACRPSWKNRSFGLLLHSAQKAGSKASKAWTRIKATHGGYSRKPKKQV